MAVGGTNIPPLTNSQKLFLQRLLVSHVLSDDLAKQLYESIKEGFADVAPSQEEEDEGNNANQGYMGYNFEHCLGIINASLVPAFNLEICTVSLPAPHDPDGETNDAGNAAGRLSQGSAGSSGGRGRKNSKRGPRLVKYHAVVNRSNDAVAKSHAFPLSRGGPHELAYYRLAIEKIVERGVEILDEEDGGNISSVGCPGSMSRMELINLRTEMEGAHEGKLTIAQTERALEAMEEGGWLVETAPPAEEESDEENEEEEDGEDDEGESSRTKRKRRKRPPPGSSGGSRRKSLRGTFYGIGPRSFMELGEFLQGAGLPGDRMPQSILHRI